MAKIIISVALEVQVKDRLCNSVTDLQQPDREDLTKRAAQVHRENVYTQQLMYVRRYLGRPDPKARLEHSMTLSRPLLCFCWNIQHDDGDV